MPGDELKAHATSTTDFYELLSLPPTFNQKELDRAWRRTALKYHPDKVGAADEAAREKFHLANIGYEILNDPAIRVLYDNARSARERKRQQAAQFEAGRRRAKDDLERRERGAKRSARDAFGGVADGNEDEDKLEREVRRLAEDGRRRRMEREEALRKDLVNQEVEKEREKAHSDEQQPGQSQHTPVQKDASTGVPELDRSVKARFARSSTGESLSEELLRSLFSIFGPVESAFMLKDKRARLGKWREKRPVGTVIVVFHSIVGAHGAVNGWIRAKAEAAAAASVEEGESQDPQSLYWPLFEEVRWAAGQEPDILKARMSNVEEENGPVTGHCHGNLSPADEPAAPEQSQEKLASTDSRHSKSSLQETNPFIAAAGSLSLEEQTLLRLRNAEKKRQEAAAAKAAQKEELQS